MVSASYRWEPPTPIGSVWRVACERRFDAAMLNGLFGSVTMVIVSRQSGQEQQGSWGMIVARLGDLVDEGRGGEEEEKSANRGRTIGGRG